MTVSAQIYIGCYGGDITNVGDIIVTSVVCPHRPISLDYKQIIFVVDESGSMLETIASVKASLFAVRNLLLKSLGFDLNQMDENVRDDFFSNLCNSSIISFNSQATCRWESLLMRKGQSSSDDKAETVSFTQAIKSISADGTTNMGAALKLALEKKSKDYMTWIILLTDGMSNNGACQTAASFKQIADNMPRLTKIIPLGYTTEFDPNTLSALGNMVYLEGEENIAEIFGGIIGEIVTCYGVNGKIKLPTIMTHDDQRDVIGSTDIGCMFNDRKFTYGRLPWGNIHIPEISKYLGMQGDLTYYDIESKQYITEIFNIVDGGDTIPDEVCENYFISSKARILLSIHQLRRRNKLTSKYQESIINKLNDWNHPLAIQHKEEILRILNDTMINKTNEMITLSNAIGAQNQCHYSSKGYYSTADQKKASEACVSDIKMY